MMRLHVNLNFMGNVYKVASHYNIHSKLLFMISLFSQERVVGLKHLPHVALQPLTVMVNKRVLSSASIFISFFFLSGVVTLPNDVQFLPSYQLTSQGDSEGCFNTDSTLQGRILTISRFIAIRLFVFTTCRRTNYLVTRLRHTTKATFQLAVSIREAAKKRRRQS